MIRKIKNSKSLSRGLALACLLSTLGSASADADEGVDQGRVETLDIMVLYTEGALTTLAGSDMEARIASYIEYSNQAYEVSGMNLRLRLVHSEEIGLGMFKDPDVNDLTLYLLSHSNQVERLRFEYGSDLVTLLTKNQGGLCGIANLPAVAPDQEQLLPARNRADAFSVIGIDCGYTALPHELGHNLGLTHSYRQGEEGVLFPWGRGYGVDGLFATIMAYPSFFDYASHIQHFSTPRQSVCAELPCGVPIDQPDGADAVTAANFVAHAVASYTTARDAAPEPGTNLVGNGDMERKRLEGWTGYGKAKLSSKKGSKKKGKKGSGKKQQNQLAHSGKRYMMVGHRHSREAGAVYDLSGALLPGANYLLDLWLKLKKQPKVEQTAQVSLYIESDAGEQWFELPPQVLTAERWSQVSGGVQVGFEHKNIRRALLYIVGPDAKVKFAVDDVSLVEVLTLAERR